MFLLSNDSEAKRMLKIKRQGMRMTRQKTLRESSLSVLTVKVSLLKHYLHKSETETLLSHQDTSPETKESIQDLVSSTNECPREDTTLIASYSCPLLFCVMSLLLHNLLTRLQDSKVSRSSHIKKYTPLEKFASSTKPSKSLSIMMPVMISMIMRSLIVSGQNCFGGIETFEKVSMTDFDENFTPAGILLQQTDQALTRDCVNLCKQQSSCLSFALDYNKFRCAAYSINTNNRKNDLSTSNTTNFFEKVCYRGIARDEYEKVCGIERLWAFERVMNAYLDGFEKIQLNNVASRSECAKACLMETTFACRSADYDDKLRICRLSKEDRRTQPQAFRIVPASHREYIENQCASPGKGLHFFIFHHLWKVRKFRHLSFMTTSQTSPSHLL